MLITVQGRDSTGKLRYIAEDVRSRDARIGTFSHESVYLVIMNAVTRAFINDFAAKKRVN